jgi:predicted transcriptional regulator
MEPISQQIRRVIEQDERTYYRIAKDAGIHQSQLLRFMDGRRASGNTLDRLGEALNLEVKQRSKRKA